MSDIIFLHPDRIHLIWGVLAFVGVIAWLELQGRDVFARFLSATMQARLTVQLSMGRRTLRWFFLALTLSLGVVALMRPQSAHTETVAARSAAADIMVVFDVSKSMLATDASPTRLERAKADLLDMLPELEGNRVGLLAFAGRASVLAPLTPDHSFFRLALASMDERSVTRGGTRIGDALRAALKAFDEETEGARLIVLITDGEDHDSYPLDAAEEVRKAGIPVVAIGFGDEEGSKIEIINRETGAAELLRDLDGNEVISRLDGETLRTIALNTKGAYIPAGTSVLDLDSIVKAHVQPLTTETSGDTTREVVAERYQWPLGGAMVTFFGVVLAGAGLHRPRGHGEANSGGQA